MLEAILTLSASQLLAQSNYEFYCGQNSDGIYATMLRTPAEVKEVIRWTSHVENWTPQERCGVVSGRFERYVIREGMDYITVGNIGGYPVICASSRPEEESGCEAELFTLKSWEEAEEFQEMLMNIIDRGFVQGPFEQGGQQTLYFDLINYISNPLSQEDGIFPLSQ